MFVCTLFEETKHIKVASQKQSLGQLFVKDTHALTSSSSTSPPSAVTSAPVVFIIAQVTQGWKWMSHWSMPFSVYVHVCVCWKEKGRQMEMETEVMESHRQREDREGNRAARCPRACMWPNSRKSLLIYLRALTTTVHVLCFNLWCWAAERFPSNKESLFFFSFLLLAALNSSMKL